MKEVSILYNGEFLSIKENDTKIFLHTDNVLTLIHLVEGQEKNFKRRLEFKKKVNDSNRYMSFSYNLNSKTYFSGSLTISSNNEITGTISYQILIPNSTHINEGYYLTINSGSYYLEHIITANIEKACLEEKQISTLSIASIEAFLFNLLNRINNLHSINNKPLIFPPYISHILNEENNIINIIESLIEKYPELEDFLKRYQQAYTRKRTFSSWFISNIW